MQTLETRVSPIGYSDNSCGYCGNSEGSFSYYAKTKTISPEFYQGLIDRGFRRSGTLLYKPDLRVSCCPHYTIRLDSSEFKASKDQRQTLNRFTNHVLGEEYIRSAGRYYPKTREEASHRKQVFDVVERVKEAELDTLNDTARKFENAKNQPPQALKPAHNFTVTLEPDTFTEEKYRLYQYYQRVVHKDSLDRISRDSFRSFLCASPLQRSSFTWENGSRVERKLGSYHQCYRLDGNLIAVGVLDLLPKTVSAVYFFYNEEGSKWNFGKLGALREIALAIEFGYQYYYMGFYIHSCIKMRYKGTYYPQFVLDPQSYEWDLFDANLKRLMDVKRYVSLSESQNLEAIVNGAMARFNNRNRSNKSSSNNAVELEEEQNAEREEDRPSTSSSTDSGPRRSLPLYLRNMPGVLNRQQLLNPPLKPHSLLRYSLDDISIRIEGMLALTSDLVGWDEDTIDNFRCTKSFIADFVAAIGWKLADEVVVAFD